MLMMSYVVTVASLVGLVSPIIDSTVPREGNKQTQPFLFYYCCAYVTGEEIKKERG
jgi:hypothetical protein